MASLLPYKNFGTTNIVIEFIVLTFYTNECSKSIFVLHTKLKKKFRDTVKRGLTKGCGIVRMSPHLLVQHT